MGKHRAAIVWRWPSWIPRNRFWGVSTWNFQVILGDFWIHLDTLSESHPNALEKRTRAALGHRPRTPSGLHHCSRCKENPTAYRLLLANSRPPSAHRLCKRQSKSVCGFFWVFERYSDHFNKMMIIATPMPPIRWSDNGNSERTFWENPLFTLPFCHTRTRIALPVLYHTHTHND